MTDIQTTWTDEQGEVWVPFSDYMHLKAALKAERNKAWNAAIEEVCDFMGDPHGIGDSFYIPHIRALITDDEEKR